MTNPNDIKDGTYKRIWQRLQELSYPCTLVVYGPERTHRTLYRGEHESAFGIAYCQDANEAWTVVDCNWPGYPPDLRIYSISGEPTEVRS